MEKDVKYSVITSVATALFFEGELELSHTFDQAYFSDYESARDHIADLLEKYTHDPDDESKEELDALDEKTVYYNNENGRADDIIAFELTFDYGFDDKQSVIVRMERVV